MKTANARFVATLVVGTALLAANTASAGWGGGGGNGGGGNGGGGGNKNSGGQKFSFGGGNGGGNGNGGKNFKFHVGSGGQKFLTKKHDHHDGHHHHRHHHGHHHHHKFHHYPVKKCYITPIFVYDQCYRPYFSTYMVNPGDTGYTISKRCYGNSNLWKHIAAYNQLMPNAPLAAGQQLGLPVVNSNGTLTPSNAPAFAGQFNQMATGSQSMVPQTNFATAANDPSRSSVAVGSAIMLRSESLGAEKGIVRLRVSGMALPVETTEWSDTAVKIQMPTMDLAGPLNAEIEVLRADGRLATKSAIQLTPAATRVALGN